MREYQIFYKKYETQNYLKNIKLKNFSFIFNNEPVRCLTCNKIFFLNEKKIKKIVVLMNIHPSQEQKITYLLRTENSIN